ncbi:MAG: glycerate kinase [Actinobacteria bacterium]|nr:glycerate kinase [Actinomycetota bacterium]MBV9665219.1 glycerate kinase [Actinomycetota bacterium]
MPRVVACPDKFRGTATATEVARAMAQAARSAGWEAGAVPLADGGEGILEVLGGGRRHTRVTGPLGEPVDAEWRSHGDLAIVEMAKASGLVLVGGAEGNDPLRASTIGTGELLAEVLETGATQVIVGMGGSATTDGGLGCLRALPSKNRLIGVELRVACDVRTHFVDAAGEFGPQKGASDAQVALLERRLERLAQVYEDDYGVDVRPLDGSGAAGGLAGGLAAIGAALEPGFDLVAGMVELEDHIEGADLVITGEGQLDRPSFDGKVVGGVLDLAQRAGVPVVVVAGRVLDGVEAPVPVVSLVERFGEERALGDTAACVAEAVTEVLATQAL